MRTTADFERLQFWRTLFDASVLCADRLAVVRAESIFRDRSGSIGIDLTFARDDGSVVVVTAIVLESLSLVRNLRRCFIWPRSVAAVVTDDAINEIEEKMLPWLRSLVRGRAFSGEYVRAWAPCPAFTCARSLGYLGAAPYGSSLVSAAPVLYAQRFGHRESARARGPHAGLWAAGLRMQATYVEHDAMDADAAWFSLAPSQEVARPDLAIVDRVGDAGSARFAIACGNVPQGEWRAIDIPQPVALDVYTTFDAADAPVVGTFSVRGVEAHERTARVFTSPAAIGGSRGVVRVALRDDAWVARDADTDDAEVLVRRMCAEGIEALAISYSRAATESADLMHFYGSADDAGLHAALARRRERGGPFALTLAPHAPWTGWAEEGHSLVGQLSVDDGRERHYRRAFEAGRFVVDGSVASEDTAGTERRRAHFDALVGDASAVFLAPGDEIDAFVARYPNAHAARLTNLPPFPLDELPSESIGALVGDRPFALLHGAVLLRNRQLPIVTALARANLPVVIAGPLSDVNLGVSMRRFANANAIFLTDPTPGELAALYRRAAVYIDASPRPFGYGRIVRAALCGALPLLPNDSPCVRLFAGNVPTFDGLSVGSAGEAIAAVFADDDAHRLRVLRAQAAIGRYADAEATFATIISAYAQA